MLRLFGAILSLPIRKFIQKGKVAFPIVILGVTFARQAAAISAATAATALVSLVANFTTYLAQVVGQLVVLLIGTIAVPLMQYNNFVDSPVVGMGWSVVRDAVNMFFVIILIVIAFGTILGVERFNWRKQIPSILIMAVVINFSRTLCGIMIDFSQVIMLTFVNAIKDIAGGNFVQMFQLKDIMTANSDSSVFTSSEGVQPFDLLAAALVALLMMLVVFVSLLFLTIALAYRIVLLWVLVTVAPLAWFFKSTSAILKPKQDPYVEWWKKFVCALQLGPILVFFLWLALAVAGSGDISSSAGFETGEGVDTGNILSAMSSSRMVSFIVGILLLFVGLDAANDACAGADKIMSSMMGRAGGISKGLAIGAPAWLGQKGMQKASAVGKRAYRETGGRMVKAARNKLGAGLGKLAENRNYTGLIGVWAGRTSAKIKAQQGMEIAEAEKERGAVSTQERVANVLAGPRTGEKKQREFLADVQAVLNDEDALKKIGPEKMAEILSQKAPLSSKTTMQTLDEIADPAWLRTKKELGRTRPSILGGKAIAEGLNETGKFRDLDTSEWEQQAIIDQAEKTDFTFTKDGVEQYEEITLDDGTKRNMNVREAIAAGRMGPAMKKKLEDGLAALAEKEKPKNLLQGDVAAIDTATLPVTSLSPEVMAQVLTKGADVQAAAISQRADTKEVIENLTGNIEQILTELERTTSKTRIMPETGVSYTERDQEAMVRAKSRLFSAGISLVKAFGLKFERDGTLSDEGAVGASDFRAAVGSNVNVAIQGLESSITSIKKMAEESLQASMVRNLLRQHRAAADGSSEKAETEKHLETIFDAARQVADEHTAAGQALPENIDRIVNHLFAKYTPS
jgi:hypothetical protein